jgi:DNA polymerase-3 subunit delta'
MKVVSTPLIHERIVGQDRALHYLEMTMRRGEIASAYLFYGPNAVGKRTTARIFLQSVLCEKRNTLSPCGKCQSCQSWKKGNHPDAYALRTHNDSAIGIDEIRILQKRITYRPTLSTHRVACIENAEALTIEASNALLKTLEEPPENTVLVLCTTLMSLLPLTLRSRCQQIRFQLVRQQLIYDMVRKRTDNADLARNISHLAIGRPGIALSLIQNTDEYRIYKDRVQALCAILLSPIEERLHNAQRLFPATKSAQEERNAVLPLFDIFGWILRDAALCRERNEDHMIHQFLRDDIEKLGTRYRTDQLVRAYECVDEMKKECARHINPMLAVEHCLLSL